MRFTTHSGLRVQIETTRSRQTAKRNFATVLRKYEEQMRELQAAHRDLSRKYEQMCKRCIRDLEQVQAAYRRDMSSLGDSAAKSGLRDLAQEAKKCASRMTDDVRLKRALQKAQETTSQAYQSSARLRRAVHDVMMTSINNIRA